MPTQQEINLAAYKSGKKPEEIQRLLQEKQGIVSAPPIQTTIAPAPTIKPSEVTAPAWASYWEANILPPSVTGFSTPKPTIATTDKPVIGTPPATTPKAVDFTTMTPEQLKAQYMTIGTKLPWEVTDEDRRFAKYLQTRIGLGETMDKIFGGTGASSGKTTYSTELVQPWENIASSVRNPDGTYNVVFKDWTSQRTTTEPSTTVFPEWTPEYFAQKKAQENQKQLDVLTEQMNTEAERRKKETADLVAKYGENIAGQFASQKAEIEAQGAKRMETLNSWLSFSGFWRSTLALDKRDEIAKNIETTITQAKAKADLELMAYRMEQEGADAEAISAMRTNIANVQANIDQANYENQLEIIKLNQENATSGAEAMNNLLKTISNSAEIVSNADLDKSQELGYFVDKNGALMLDSQKRPIQFEGNRWTLDPTAIGAYADAIKNKIIDEKILDTLSPADKDAVMKLVWVRDGSWTGWFTDISQATGDVRSAPWAQQYAWREAWATTNNPSGITVNNNFSAKLEAAGIQFSTKPRPSNEWGEYYVFSDISDGLKAHQIALKNSGWQDVYTRLYKWSAGGVNTTPQDIKEANKKAYAENLMRQAGIPMGTKFSELTPEQENKLLSAHIAKESPNLAKILGTGGQGGGVDVIASLSPSAKAVIDQINQNGGKPQDYILGTSKDSQALLDEVLKGLNSQWGSGTLASDTRKQSLALATNTIEELLKNKDFAGSFQTRRVWDTGLWSVFNLTANENVNFVNRVDALAGQLMQIDWPTLKAIFWPQISNSDIEMIKKTILQGLDPKNQNPEAFEKTLNDVKAKMQAYINRLPKNQSTGTANTVGTVTPPIGGWQVVNGAI